MTLLGVQVVAVGGTVPSAIVQVVGELSRRAGLAIIASCPRLDADELRRACEKQVIIVENHLPLEVDRVYLAPSDRLVSIADRELVVGAVDDQPFDGLLRSVAAEAGRDAIGIVLAGTGADGSIGIKRVKEEGGLAIAQLVSGTDGELPQAAIDTGIVDLVLPLARIASQLGALLDHPARPIEDLDEDAGNAETVRDLLALVRTRTGHDFSTYKHATLYRRILRRMQVHDCTTVEAYDRYLREHSHELAHLLRDFLISVTNFFRDPEVFATVARDVIPGLFASKGPSDQVRVWVAGCATGEEAYSIGMLLLEHASTLPMPPPIQIFATDIDEIALTEARRGTYPEAIAADVSAARLHRFFVRDDGHFRVSKELRELVLFSPHNVLSDPPFSRLDLVSCRNLLIYLNRTAQLRVLSMFHFGLRVDGVLLLGSSESAEGSSMFGALDAKNRLYSRRLVPAMSLVTALDTPPPRWQVSRAALPSYLPRERSTSLADLHFRLIEYYAPPSILIDSALDVIHLSENAGQFLTIIGGEPTRQILRIVTPPLRLELRSAIYAARQQGSDNRVVRYEQDGEVKTVELRVRAVDIPELAQGAMLVTFDQLPPTVPVAPRPALAAGMEPVVREIEEDLHRTRDQLRTTIEQYETSLEELKASNEELQAINEELRSATEELETSKEEMQSVNEELTTLNQELKIKVDEVSQANSDLQNLMSSTEIGVIFLDRKLAIKRFTPRIADLFNIIPSDIGRPIAHVTHRLQCDDLTETAQHVLASLRVVEKRVSTLDDRSYLVRWLPYRSIDDRIDGIVITFVDVSDLRDAVAARRRSEDALVRVEERLRVALRAAPVTVLSFDATQKLVWAYSMGRELQPPQFEPLQIFTLDQGQRMIEIVRQVAAQRIGQRAELDVGIGETARTYDFRIEPVPTGVAAVGFDISPSKRAETSLRDADRRKDEFLATLSHELRNPLAPLKIALDVARLVDHDPERRLKSLEVMERQVSMLAELVDELLDLSRITQGKVALERVRVDLHSVISRAVESTVAAAESNHHELVVVLPPEPLPVIGDVRRLVQIFTNLLINAIKFTPPHGRIEVTGSTDRTRGMVTIRIGDNGVGIPPASLKHIFEIFVQSRDAAGRAQGGLGIGLNVVHRLVELHGGVVTATSDGIAGHGSAFTVELPLGRDA